MKNWVCHISFRVAGGDACESPAFQRKILAKVDAFGTPASSCDVHRDSMFDVGFNIASDSEVKARLTASDLGHKLLRHFEDQDITLSHIIVDEGSTDPVKEITHIFHVAF